MDVVRIEKLEAQVARNEQNSIVIEQANRVRVEQFQGAAEYHVGEEARLQDRIRNMANEHLREE